MCTPAHTHAHTHTHTLTLPLPLSLSLTHLLQTYSKIGHNTAFCIILLSQATQYTLADTDVVALCRTIFKEVYNQVGVAFSQCLDLCRCCSHVCISLSYPIVTAVSRTKVGVHYCSSLSNTATSRYVEKLVVEFENFDYSLPSPFLHE